MEKSAIIDRQHVHGRLSAITDRQHVHEVYYRRSLIASMCMRSTIGDHGSPACVFERISADSRLYRMRSSTNTCVYICISVVKDRQHLEAMGLG